MTKLPKSFYRRDDVVRIARDLLGKRLMTKMRGSVTGGIITEAEAYAGVKDRASHAYGGRRTKRTETMYRAGGITYIYLCYGIHSLLNVVTNVEGEPDAVLIRAIAPAIGLPMMLRRRRKKKASPALAAGPGTLAEALGINTQHDTEDLCGSRIWLEDCGIAVQARDVVAGPRVGVDYAGPDAKRPWRFRVETLRLT